MKHKIETEEIHSIHPADLVLHPEALATPKMNAEQYESLKRDIEIQGQLDPITTYRGKIVDGRHRWLIIQELGIDTIKYKKMPNNSKLQDIKDIVNSREMRRHETASQLAIRAYRLKTDPKLNITSFSNASDIVGANRKRVGEVKKIVELYGRNDIIELLFAGEKFNTGSERVPFWTDSLGTILNWLAENAIVVGKEINATKIKPEQELSEEQQLLVNTYLKALDKECELVRESVVKAVYSKLKGDDNE